jgi:Flp pilus assembly protein TadG
VPGSAAPGKEGTGRADIGDMTSRRRRTERGAALAEFALVVPFLVLVVMGTIDFGRSYTFQNRLINAAREGAAFARYYPAQVSNSGACADPENITYKALGEDAGSAAGFTVSVTNVDTGAAIAGPCIQPGGVGAVSPGTRIKVTVSGVFTPMTPIARPFIGGSSMTIRRSAEVVVEG